MRCSLSGIYKKKQESMSVRSFGKLWKPSDRVRVFYPVFREDENSPWDIVAACMWGHNWNLKEDVLKRVFVPTLCKLDEDGNPIGKDILQQFSPIAKLIVSGNKAAEKSEIENNTHLTSTQKKVSTEKIEKDYSNVDPLVGSLFLKIFTECIMINIDKSDVPDFDYEKSGGASQVLSNTKLNALRTIVTSKSEYIHDLGNNVGLMEVLYVFGTDTKKGDAGKHTSILPVTKDDSLILKEAYSDQVLGLCNSLPFDSDVMLKRNLDSRPVSEVQIKQAISLYMASNYNALDGLEDEVDIENLKKHADALDYLDIPVTLPDVVEEVEKCRAKRKEAEKKAKEAEATAKTKAQEVKEKAEEKVKVEPPTVDSLAKENADVKKAEEEDKEADEVPSASGLNIEDTDITDIEGK